MTEPAQNASAVVQFIDNDLPALIPGDYAIHVSQKIQIDAGDARKNANETFSMKDGEQAFSILGPRFILDPQEVQAVFPPPGSLGDHSMVLPHIIFKRSTLPWELSKAGEAVPWLALLLFEEQDFADPLVFGQIKIPRSCKLSELRGWSGLNGFTASLPGSQDPGNTKQYRAYFPEFQKRSGDVDDEILSVIDVSQSLLAQILPTPDELKLLAHVRRTTDGAKAIPGSEAAVIVCSRLPGKDSLSVAHLVSLEGRYKDDHTFDFQGAQGDDFIRLVSLYCWRFTCASADHDFKGLLTHLVDAKVPHTLRLPPLTSSNAGANAAAEGYFSLGCVPLPHSMRQGNQSVSWYHGPFVPGAIPTEPAALPARSADSLVRYNPGIGMFDVSYAAAWELGRLLTLQNKRVSVDLFNWKRSQVRSFKEGLNRKAAPQDHLNFDPHTALDLPETVQTWFDNLALLRGLPFNYLAPDENLLPAESIRFFQVDPWWVECLRDGAFSIGRVLSGDLLTDRRLKEAIAPLDLGALSGFLLRSAVVAGWPGLLADGYQGDDLSLKLQILRMDRLSKNILLCLFNGVVQAVDLHQKPEGIHFGVAQDQSGKWVKEKRNEQGQADQDHPVEVLFKGNSTAKLVLDIAAIANSAHLNTPTSADFAFQMIEGVDKVRFKI